MSNDRGRQATKFSIKTLQFAIAALGVLYLVFPLDLLPDPIIIDDVTINVITMTLTFLLGKLKRYSNKRYGTNYDENGPEYCTMVKDGKPQVTKVTSKQAQNAITKQVVSKELDLFR